MSSFKQVQILKQPKFGQIVSDSTLYWKDYEFPSIINEYGGINHINVSPSKPHLVSATHGSRIHIYDSNKKVSVKSFSFSENVYSASFRDDGKLLCAGFESNCARVYPLFDDPTQQLGAENNGDEGGGEGGKSKMKKTALRKFDNHFGPVHVAKFMRNIYHVMTASDDAHVRLFDLSTSQTLMKLKAHKDYIRCGVASKSSDDLLLTGSYDHTVKMIDTRSNTAVLTVDHGDPIENVLLFPSSNIFISCGSNSIKVWDVLKGGNLMRTMINHHKTVTALAFSHNFKYLLSGGLDRHIKVFDLLNYELVHTIDYPSPILSLGILPEDKCLIVGMSDGLVSMKDRRKHDFAAKSAKDSVAAKDYYASSIANKSTKFNPYKYVSPSLINNSANDHMVTHATKQHLKKYDKHLKKFNATKALDSALEHKIRTKTPQVTIGVMQELIRRGNIKTALSGKSEKSLGVLVKFIQRNVSNPNYTATLTDISNMLLDIYADDIGKYAAIDDLFVRLKQTIDMEIQYQTNLLQIIGTLETIFVAQNTITN